jgi:hypothetical protein
MYPLIILLILLLFTTPSFSEELEFLFSTDQNIKSEDIKEKVSTEKDISGDSWFSSPPTRLELLTYTLDQHFKKEIERKWEYLSKEVDKYFEKNKISVTEDVSAFFQKEQDVFIVKVEISDLGKPKKPMKDFCDYLLDHFSLFHAAGGYSLQNTILRSFIFGSYDDPEILRIVNLLRNNLVFLVTLQSNYGNEKNGLPRDYYYFHGWKFTQEKEIHYSKWSYSSKP